MRDRYIEVHGLNLHLLEWGEGADLTVLLLHGYLDMAWSWQFMVDAWRAQGLPEGARLVALDWRGHGQSDRIGAGGYYHFIDYVRELQGVIQALGADEAPGRLMVVGHSMGAGVATLWAGTQPRALDALVLVEGIGVPPSAMTDLPERTRRWLSQTVPFDPGAILRPMDDLEAAVKRLMRFDALLPETRARVLARHATAALADGRLAWRYDPLHRTRSPVPILPEMADIYAQQIKVPTLWIGGSESPWQGAALDARLSQISGLERQVLPGAGHMVQHHQPEALARVISEFAGQALSRGVGELAH